MTTATERGTDDHDDVVNSKHKTHTVVRSEAPSQDTVGGASAPSLCHGADDAVTRQ